MDYALSAEQFLHGKMFDSKGQFSHKTGNRFKLFPFVTHPNSEPVLELNNLIGALLCRIEGEKPEEITADMLITSLIEIDDTEIEQGQEDRFAEVIKILFFDDNGRMRPLCLKMLEQTPCDNPSELKVIEYLADVLGDKGKLKELLLRAHQQSLDASNVIEKLVLSKLKRTKRETDQSVPYFRVTDSLKNVFEGDFKYIIENPKRSREYLVELFEFYFFTYTAQTALQLNRFLYGSRTDPVPLYFCLEWEKTSQSRQCFTEGWQQLQNSIDKIFAHAVTLEILNHTEPGAELVDYIDLKQIIDSNPALDSIISEQIDEVTKLYRENIKDCAEMNEVKKGSADHGATDASVKFLFDSIKSQFENSVRVRAYDSYSSKFERYCHKYLKSRGRSGLMLNLSEETLIFLTKLCIKNQEQMRLKDVFGEMELRSVYLDNQSKEQAAIYYEKLNLIEKKSDSGDAKYVKRIL